MICNNCTAQTIAEKKINPAIIKFENIIKNSVHFITANDLQVSVVKSQTAVLINTFDHFQIYYVKKN